MKNLERALRSKPIYIVVCLSLLYACQPAPPNATETSAPPTLTPVESHTQTPVPSIVPTEIIIDDDCFDSAFTQVAMNFCAAHHVKRTEEFLASINFKLKNKMSKNHWAVFHNSTQSWDKFIEDDCTWIADEYWGGSIRPLIYLTCVAGHNSLRIKLLSRFICAEEKTSPVCTQLQEYFKGDITPPTSIEQYAENPCRIGLFTNQELHYCLNNHSLYLQEILNTVQATVETEKKDQLSKFTSTTNQKPGAEGWPEDLIELMSARAENFPLINSSFVILRLEYCHSEKFVSSSLSIDYSGIHNDICFSALNAQRINLLLGVCSSCDEVLEGLPDN